MPATIWVLAAGNFVNRFGDFGAVFLVPYLVSLHYPIQRIGIAVAVIGAGSLAASLIGGSFVDRWGGRLTIWTSLLLSAVAAMLVPSAASFGFEAELCAIAFFGLTSNLNRPAFGALLAESTSLDQRVTAGAVLRLSLNAGMSIGPAVAGLLATQSFLLLFVGDAITSAIFALVALLALPRRQASGSVRQRSTGSYASVLADTRFLLFTANVLVLVAIYGQARATLPLHVQVNALPSTAYGLLLSLNGLATLLLEIPLTAWTQHLRPRPLIAVGSLIIGMGFAATGLAHTFAQMAGTVAVWTFGEMLVFPILLAHVASVAPPGLRGRYQAAYGMASGIGRTLGPWIGLWLFAAGDPWVWVWCGVFGLVAGGLGLAGVSTPSAVTGARPAPTDG